LPKKDRKRKKQIISFGMEEEDSFLDKKRLKESFLALQ
jgi:hypothetical protein